MPNENYRPARLADDFSHIIDSSGERVELTDERVTHVYVTDNHDHTKQLILNTYKQYGIKCRVAGRTGIETMKQARQLCSGRECVPCVSIIGNILMDIANNREPGEITFYIGLDQEGPCQNGAWPVMWDSFSRRLEVENAIFDFQPKTENRNLGLPRDHLMWSSIWYVVGSILAEAEISLKLAAENPVQAMEIFKAATEPILTSIKTKRKLFESAIANWVEQMARIPLKTPVQDIPKILIFGGLNLFFVHYPVTDFFISQGVIPKVVSFAEGSSWLSSEPAVRYGLKAGIMSPQKQFEVSEKNTTDPDLIAAVKANESLRFIDQLEERYKNLMAPSGLLFDPHMTYAEVCETGHKWASNSAFTETTVSVGRYILAGQSGVYDGFINLGSFNCQPAMNAQIIIRPLANKSDIPYAAIDVEGPQIATNQQRLLEAIAVQAKRLKIQKNQRS